MIITLLSLQIASCGQNFTFSKLTNSCVCEFYLNSNKSMCAEKCEDFNEKQVNGKCVKQIALKGASNNIDCMTLYNQGSIWDGGSQCKCAAGYAGAQNSFCTDCKRLGQVVSGTSCAACPGNTVLQGTMCNECTNMIPSADKLSCVTCSSRYGDGSIYSSSGTCVCDTANGFAGATNSVCTDCWRKGQAVSGTSCAVCSGTQVLQSGSCAECPANFVPSADKQSCISCSQRYGQGSIYSTINTCVCDSSNGFAGSSNSICSYCWVLGKTISGSSCASCPGTQVLQSGTCQECPINLVPSADKLSCVSCASRYGEASTFISFGLCRCTAFGFAGSDNSVCSDCLRMGQMISGATCSSCPGTQVLQAGVCAECPTNFVPSADKLSCISCSQRYGDGSSYSAVDKCICDTTTGFTALTQNSICTDCWRQGKAVSGNSCASCASPLVLQQGACSQCSNDLVPSADGLSCVTCSSRYGSGSAFESFGTCRCSASGFAGNDNTICVDCLRVNKFVSGTAGSTICAACSGTTVLQSGACAECPANFVPSADKLSCVTCVSLYGPGSSYSAINTCVCQVSEGFGGADNSICEDCKRSGKEASATGCTACTGTQVLQSGTCQDCPAGSVPSLDKLSCVAQSTCQVNYGPGSYEFAAGTCRCQSSSGFAGNDNQVCVDCIRIGQFVSGAAGSTACASCPGTQVLQAGSCSECPANFVPSADKLSCVSCSQRYGDGSSYSAVGTCVCDSSNGFTAASSNSICTDCWRQGKAVSGNSCASCASPLVLQQGACSQCSNDLVPSADGLSCVTCSSKYGSGSAFESFGTCRCSASGFGGNDNEICSDCWRQGKSVSGAAGATACAACSGTQVLQSGACADCPANLVQSADKLSCVTCASLYGPGSSYSSANTCACQVSAGFGGADNSICEDCKRSGKEASVTGCTACSASDVLQSGTCQACPAGSVPSLDKLSCVAQSTCQINFGPGSYEVTPGTCRCQSSSGFAGSDNQVCVDCIRIGQFVSGTAGSTTCESCTGTQVLQSGTCQECPANFVPSADKLSCVTCSSKFGDGSVFLSTGTCRCSDVLGFGGNDNEICSDCWRQGKSVSGAAGATACAACSGTQVLQSGACADCPANLVQSADKLSCVTCASLYGPGSSYSSANTCACQVSAGFGGADNSICEDCKRSGKEASVTGCTACSASDVLQSGTCQACPAGSVPSLDKLSCVAQSTCQINFGPGSYEVTPGTCRCQSSSGFAGSDNQVCVDCIRIGQFVSGTAGSTTCAPCPGTQVLQSGVCQECPANFVPSADKLSCVTCSSKFGDGSVFLSTGTCRCSDVLGFGGNDNEICSDCWRQGKSVSGAAGATACAACSGTQVLQSGACADCPANLVQSADKLSCVTCASLYGPGSSYSSANTCACQVSAGFGGADNSICEDCKRSGKEASVTGCVACIGTQVLQSGTCQACPAGSVPSLDKLSCVAQSTCQINFGPGSYEVTPGTCRCQSSSGFAGSDNQVCVDCIRIGQFVSGTAGSTTCAPCPGTQVLQSGVCQECPANFVPSADKLSCVTCSSKFGDGSVFLSTGTCRCSDVLGFGGNDNEICSDCWRQGKSVSGAAGATACAACSGTQVLQSGACADCPANLVQSADKLSCVTCASLYGPGSSYSSANTCACQVSAGFGGADNSICEDCKRSGKEASVTGCTACSASDVLQSGTCQACPAGSVPSLDKLSCVAQSTCQINFGPGSYEFAPGTCRCQSSSGFAGSDNQVCVDCIRIGQFVSGTAGSTTCAPCPGTQVLQSGVCQECPANFVPSADKLSCVTCSSKFGDGSVFLSTGTCRCSDVLGFGGNDNEICSDCWRQGKSVSGAAGATACAACSGTQVLQSGACADCPANLVQSADKLSCVTCASLYGPGSSYSSANTCACQVSAGFGGADNSICEDCKRSGKEASVTGCTACIGTQVLQSGTCQECQSGSVQSSDKLSCVTQSTCSTQYGPGSQEITPGTCRCTASGFAGNDNTVCVDCLRIGKVVSGSAGATTCEPCSGTTVLQAGVCSECIANFVPSEDKASCISCAQRYGQGSIYSAINTCVCDSTNGFAGVSNSICSDCWRKGLAVSGTSCSPCPGTTVLQLGSCAECPNDLVPSADELSCVSCASRYGEASTFVSFGLCRCTAFGFAGSDNSVCSDCLRMGQMISGATCSSCSGTTVLQSGVCAECPANFVPSSDKLSCISCSQRFGQGSIYSAIGTCICDSSNGFAGASNSICSYCWVLGKTISGSLCASCSGTQVLQSGTCQECPANFVPSADKLSCISCSQRYGDGSSYSAVDKCICDTTTGFTALTQNSICTDCWRQGKAVSGNSCASCAHPLVLQQGVCAQCSNDLVPSADGLSCVTCSSKYGSGSAFESFGTCRCSASGFAGNDNTICVDCLRVGQFVSGAAGSTSCASCSGTQVLQSGVCQECPTNFVPSADKLSCVTCASLYGPGSSYSSANTCACQVSVGFGGADNSICEDCKRSGKEASVTGCTACSASDVLQSGTCKACPAGSVQSLDKLSCVAQSTCQINFGPGSYEVTPGTCRCQSSSGFAGSDNQICVDCIRIGQFVSGTAGSTTCESCTGTQVLQSGTCQECPANFVPSADKLSCVTCSSKFGDGSVFLSTGTCRCSDVLGFGGNDNEICSDCWRQGKSVSGAAGATACAACSGTQVLQSGACADCPANLVQSADKLSCVTCASLYGPGSSYSSANTCACQVSAGFGGADNSICEDCKRSGKEASVTGCTACIGTQVLQSGTCQECPAGSVQSADKLTCVTQSTCSTQYGPGSQEITPGTCRCTASGFAGNDNTVCVDCLRIGKVVSGSAGATTCEPCSGTTVLQAGVCSECIANFVPSEDKASCISCAQRYGHGSIYSAINICICDQSTGFAGTQNSVCAYCWVLGETVSGSSCSPCPGTTVLQSGTCQECPSNLVPSLDKLSCTTCSSKFGDGSIFYSFGVCRCQNVNGFAGKENEICTDCWRIGKQVSGTVCDDVAASNCAQGEVQNPISKVCTCNAVVGFTGSVGSCYCNNQQGYAQGSNPMVCDQCWGQNKLALVSGCVACGNGEIFDDLLKSCVCDQTAGFVGQVGKCSCNGLLGHAPGLNPNQCEDCWANSQIALQASCQACGVGEIFENSSKTCVCNKLLGFTGSSGFCSCNTLLGHAPGSDLSQCENCWANSQIALQSKCQSCGVGEKFEPTQNICICDQDSRFVGQVGKCKCDISLGFAPKTGSSPLQCEDCWTQSKLALTTGCQSCANGEIFDTTLNSCVCDQALGFVGQVGKCSCNTLLGYAPGSDPSQCVNCWASSQLVTQLKCQDCGVGEKFDTSLKFCICNTLLGFSGTSGSCSCNNLLGYSQILNSNPLECKNCWQLNQTSSQSQCQPCGLHEVFDIISKTCVCDSSNGFVLTGGSCQCNANLGLTLLQGQLTCSCNPLTGHVTLAGGSCGCDSSSGLAGVTGACYCDYKKGFTGQPGKCYCNTALGFSPKMENGAIKSCECNANTGHLMLSDFVDDVSEKTCACNGQTGHAGEAGACYCDSATGNVGFPGSCFCNVNTFYIGKPGSCVNCGLKNAHPWQVGSDYVCQCNGVEGYGSPDANGVCKLCQSSNSVVKIDKDKQYQCVPCGLHQFVPDSNNTLCLCNTSLFYVETPVNNSCVCQPQYILGSKGCEKSGNSSRVTIIAISVPLVILIILIILIIALVKERKRRIKKHEIAEKQLKKMGPARLIVM
ncbi:Cysteine-rich_membrane protein 1 [Hexamita inflata]|uniref:Cysteine-rich_membrane protein 1 n=1 Tax=Hexamita inflata TaxID=28002 RepID=A0ABP1JAL9_9EUKA